MYQNWKGDSIDYCIKYPRLFVINVLVDNAIAIAIAIAVVVTIVVRSDLIFYYVFMYYLFCSSRRRRCRRRIILFLISIRSRIIHRCDTGTRIISFGT